MNVGIMSANYKCTPITSEGITLTENQYRRYLAVYCDAEVTIEFDGDAAKTITLPAGMPWAPLTSPTNPLKIKSAGTGLIMEA